MWPFKKKKTIQTANEERVYCSECEFLEELYLSVTPDKKSYNCNAPENIYIPSTWRLREDKDLTFRRYKPYDKNSYNYCDWFSPKQES